MKLKTEDIEQCLLKQVSRHRGSMHRRLILHFFRHLSTGQALGPCLLFCLLRKSNHTSYSKLLPTTQNICPVRFKQSFSRVRSSQGNPSRPARFKKNSRPDPTRPTRFKNLLTRPDRTRPVIFQTPPDPTPLDPRDFESLPLTRSASRAMTRETSFFFFFFFLMSCRGPGVRLCCGHALAVVRLYLWCRGESQCSGGEHRFFFVGHAPVFGHAARVKL